MEKPLAIIGAGRVGRVLGRRLHQLAGKSVWPLRETKPPRAARSSAQGNRTAVLHTSGAQDSRTLALVQRMRRRRRQHAPAADFQRSRRAAAGRQSIRGGGRCHRRARGKANCQGAPADPQCISREKKNPVSRRSGTGRLACARVGGSRDSRDSVARLARDEAP